MACSEVQLKVRGCVETETEQWMRERFGPQDTAQSKANKVVYAEIARLLFGEQDAEETLKRLNDALKRVHRN